MQIASTYRVKIRESEYNRAFADTAAKYRMAVDFFIRVALSEWDAVRTIPGSKRQQRYLETITVATKNCATPKCDFKESFYKFPSYLRRAAITEAIGAVSSYHTRLAAWEENPAGKKPGLLSAGFTYPALYRDNTFVRSDSYTAEVKVWIRNTWDWVTVTLNKGDCDYITRHCAGRKECVPTLRRRGKKWFLDFSFLEKASLQEAAVEGQIILAADLGINHACTCAAMTSEGTILGRAFLKLPREQDSLNHAVNRIRKAQQHGAVHMPKLWAAAKGINNNIAAKTAEYIIRTALQYSVHTIVFEKLELSGKKHGSRKQRLHLWKAQAVQRMVTDKAHRLGMHVSHVNAWNTSRLAYDGSGRVTRGKEAGLNSYSLCRFQSGKTYDCDLNAAYNIGARYFIREIMKSSMATSELGIPAKVPECTRRSTCTLSTLISLNAVRTAQAV